MVRKRTNKIKIERSPTTGVVGGYTDSSMDLYGNMTTTTSNTSGVIITGTTSYGSGSYSTGSLVWTGPLTTPVQAPPNYVSMMEEPKPPVSLEEIREEFGQKVLELISQKEEAEFKVQELDEKVDFMTDKIHELEEEKDEMGRKMRELEENLAIVAQKLYDMEMG